jgi:NO-binding membrane sensor protein with MHYT domain
MISLDLRDRRHVNLNGSRHRREYNSDCGPRGTAAPAGASLERRNDCSVDCHLFPRSLYLHSAVRTSDEFVALIVVNANAVNRMCQARMSVQFSSVLAWTMLGSLTFGFCAIWCLHFVAMLACELDLPIGINVPLTLLSAVLAVLITFAALASDLLWNAYKRGPPKRRRVLALRGAENGMIKRPSVSMHDSSSHPLLGQSAIEDEEDYSLDGEDLESPPLEDLQEEVPAGMVVDAEEERQPTLDMFRVSSRINSGHEDNTSSCNGSTLSKQLLSQGSSPSPKALRGEIDGRPSLYRSHTSGPSISQRSDSFMGSTLSTYGLDRIMNIAYRSTAPAKNAFIATGEALYTRCTLKNVVKSFFWSLAITSMHYVGIAALRIPQGSFTLHPVLVILSALISWVVCLVGCILMSHIETNFAQQFLFAAVACIGVATMHFTGKSICLRTLAYWLNTK